MVATLTRTRRQKRQDAPRSLGRRKGGLCPYCGRQHRMSDGRPSPWWHKQKQAWVVSIVTPEGKQAQRVMARGWHEHDKVIMAWEAGQLPTLKKTPARSTVSVAGLTARDIAQPDTLVGDLVEWYLVKHTSHLRAKTLERYTGELRRFQTALGGMTLAELSEHPEAVTTWFDSLPLSATTANTAWVIVRGCFRKIRGWMAFQPLDRVELRQKPNKRRITHFSDAQIAVIYKHARPDFALAFRVLLNTGIRPDEFSRLTAKHFQPGGSFVLQTHEHKTGKKIDDVRVIYLTNEMITIVRDQMKQHPIGPLFRSSKGRGWTEDSMTQAFRRITAKPEVAEAGNTIRGEWVRLNDYTTELRNNGRGKMTPRKVYRFVVYSARHTFAHRCLCSGISVDQTAQWLGHRNGSLVASTYGHKGDDPANATLIKTLPML